MRHPLLKQLLWQQHRPRGRGRGYLAWPGRQLPTNFPLERVPPTNRQPAVQEPTNETNHKLAVQEVESHDACVPTAELPVLALTLTCKTRSLTRCAVTPAREASRAARPADVEPGAGDREIYALSSSAALLGSCRLKQKHGLYSCLYSAYSVHTTFYLTISETLVKSNLLERQHSLQACNEKSIPV